MIFTADAFCTFKDLLTRHKATASKYLESQYESFFPSYRQLLLSQNFVTQLNSTKLLSELLTDRNNINVMKSFISDSEHLKLTMNLLLHKAPAIQIEAFHIFKIFVLNPNKPDAVMDILLKNKKLLEKLLSDFLPELTEWNHFQAEKSSILNEITDLKST